MNRQIKILINVIKIKVKKKKENVYKWLDILEIKNLKLES